MLDCGKLLTGTEVGLGQTRATGKDKGGRYGVAAPLLLAHGELRRPVPVRPGTEVHGQDDRSFSHGADCSCGDCGTWQLQSGHCHCWSKQVLLKFYSLKAIFFRNPWMVSSILCLP